MELLAFKISVQYTVCYTVHLSQNVWHSVCSIMMVNVMFALSKASTWASGVQMRNLFFSVLMFSEIADPVKL